MEEAARLWGITDQGWIAIATFVGAGAVLLSGAAVLFGIWYGAKQYLNEQEARDVRRYYIDEGLWALSRSLDVLFQAILQNYTALLHLMAQLDTRPAGTSDAPKVGDLPKLAVLDWQEVPIRGLRPALVILDFGHFEDLAVHAFGEVLIYHQGFLEIEQIVRTYYAGGEAHEGLAKTLLSRCDVLSGEAGKFGALPAVIEAAGVRLQKLRVSSFSQVEQIASDDMEIQALKDDLKELWDEVKPSEAEDDEKDVATTR